MNEEEHVLFNAVVTLARRVGVSFELSFSETESRWEVMGVSPCRAERFMTGDRISLKDALEAAVDKLEHLLRE